MGLFDEIKKYFKTEERSDFRNQDISDAILRNIKKSNDLFSAGRYIELAKYMRVSVSQKHYKMFSGVFATAVAGAVDEYIRKVIKEDSRPLAAGHKCCFEVVADPKIKLPDNEEIEDPNDYIKVYISSALPEDEHFDFSKAGEDCTGTIRTTEKDGRKEAREYDGLIKPIVIDNKVYFILQELVNGVGVSDKAYQTSAKKASGSPDVYATLTGIGGKSRFLSLHNSRSNTYSMRVEDLPFSGRIIAPNQGEGARIDADNVSMNHFMIHRRKGKFFLEPWGAVSVNGLPLVTDNQPWVPLDDGDTIELPEADVKFRFDIIK